MIWNKQTCIVAQCDTMPSEKWLIFLRAKIHAGFSGGSCGMDLEMPHLYFAPLCLISRLYEHPTDTCSVQNTKHICLTCQKTRIRQESSSVLPRFKPNTVLEETPPGPVTQTRTSLHILKIFFLSIICILSLERSLARRNLKTKNKKRRAAVDLWPALDVPSHLINGKCCITTYF